MNYQCECPRAPLRVFLINPLLPSVQLLMVKILSGSVFGSNQKIHLILFVHDNEAEAVEALKIELEKCAYSCRYYIELISNFPSTHDADVFCFLTNMKNPNYVDFTFMHGDEELNTIQFLITLANNFNNVPNVTEVRHTESNVNTQYHDRDHTKEIKEELKFKPIFIADGLVTMNTLFVCSNNLPSEVFFCPTALETVAKMILGDYLKTSCDTINDVLIWAGNDESFHIEVLKPVIVNEAIGDSKCNHDVIGKHLMELLKMDHTQFSPSWMKKDFIDKVKSVATRNPYGPTYRASAMATSLKSIWTTRMLETKRNIIYTSLGVISDGSYETIKEAPYILPLILSGDSWTVNQCFLKDPHIKSEVKRINAVVKRNSQMLKSYCLKFLEGSAHETLSEKSTFSSYTTSNESSR